MDESTTTVRLPRAARRFGHVCAFFHNREEEYRVLLPLAKEGFERGEKVFHIVDPDHRPERTRRLEEVGISPAASQRPGQVEIRAWEDAYVRGGRFDKDAMMILLEETLAARRPTASVKLGCGLTWNGRWVNSRGLRIWSIMKAESITSCPDTTT